MLGVAVLVWMSSVSATIDQVSWLSGTWRGSLGDQTVEESWSAPVGGMMGTMVRLSTGERVDMVELITIREDDGTLVLHVRQFSPSLELRLAQDMPLERLGVGVARFVAPDGAAIPVVEYQRDGDDLRVAVTLGNGATLTAELERVAAME